MDVNVLYALTEEVHIHHQLVMSWLASCTPERWALCSFTEAGFLRLSTNPSVGRRTLQESLRMLQSILEFPGFRFWPIPTSAVTLTAPIASRLFGHQQVVDACLLGLAIQENAVLVTLDKAIRYLAGAEFSRNVLLLE